MKVAIVGCSHGELEKIYHRILEIEAADNTKIDLLICCGDFQAARNEADLLCMAIPRKFHDMRSFYKYYSGDRTAPVLTLFIGGNHEASNYLQELPYGGWVAPNIYYLGYAGVVNFGGLRIGGLSGIYKAQDYMRGHFERTPYNEDTKRSVYHVRNLEVFRLKQLSNTLDIMLSHDWPREVYTYGNIDELLRNKPFFENEVNENKLGSVPCQELLSRLKPKNWFAAHLHTRFCAQVPHFDTDGSRTSETNFLALDKCLPRRNWIEVVDFPSTDDSRELTYDLEWLTILYLTDHLLSSKRTTQFMPGPNSDERWNFTPTNEEKEFVKKRMNDDLRIPTNFARTAPFFNGYQRNNRRFIPPPEAINNPQTLSFCNQLGVRDPIVGVVDDVNKNSRISRSYQSSSFEFSTPERRYSNNATDLSFNSSYTSDRESFYSSRSSICSDASFAESPNPSLKRFKLSLEPPTRNSLHATDPNASLPSSVENLFTIDRNGSVLESESTEINDETSSDYLSFTIDRNGSVTGSESTSITVPNSSEFLSTNQNGLNPEVKSHTPTFRRRNANLYAE